jgi:hypothetical protein
LSAAKKSGGPERVKHRNSKGRSSVSKNNHIGTLSGQPDIKSPEVLRFWYLAAISAGLLLTAATIRWISYINVPLWLDEAWRANIILGVSGLHDLVAPQAVQPLPGYVALVRFFSLFHVNELVLRLSSLLSGALTPLALFIACFLFSRKIFLSVFAALLAAFNSDLVGYAHEMKPYAFEALLHGCYWIVLFYWLQDRTRVGRFYIFCAFFLVMLFSTPTAIFLLPATLLAFLMSLYRADSWRSRMPYVSALAGTLLLTIVVYILFFASSAGNSGLYAYWGDNFYSSEKGSRLAWTFKMLSDQFAQAYATPANALIANWQPWINLMAVVTLPALIYFGFTGKKDRETLLYVCSPLLVLFAVNFLKIWPLGAIRANIFMIPNIILVFVLCMNSLFSRVPNVRNGVAVLASLLLFVNFLPAMIDKYKILNPPLENMPAVMQRASQGMTADPELQKYPILVNQLGSAAYLFYTQYREEREKYFHPTLLHEQAIPIADAYSGPVQARKQMASALEGKPGAQFFISHLNNEEIGKLKLAIQDIGWAIQLEQNEGTADWLVLRPERTHHRG